MTLPEKYGRKLPSQRQELWYDGHESLSGPRTPDIVRMGGGEWRKISKGPVVIKILYTTIVCPTLEYSNAPRIQQFAYDIKLEIRYRDQ